MRLNGSRCNLWGAGRGLLSLLANQCGGDHTLLSALALNVSIEHKSRDAKSSYMSITLWFDVFSIEIHYFVQWRCILVYVFACDNTTVTL